MKKIKRFASSMMAVMLAGTLTVGSLSVAAFGAEDAGSVESTSVETSFEEATEEVETGVSDSAVSDTSEIATEEEVITSYTVTLDANGGYFQNEWDDVLNETLEKTEILNKIVPVGGLVSTVPVYEQEGITATFLGWSLERDGEILPQEQEGYVPVDSCVLYAVWEPDETTKNVEVADIQESEKAEEVPEDDSLEDQDMVAVDENFFEDYKDDIEESISENDNQTEQSDDIAEEGEQESVTTDASLNVVNSGTCGDNLTWTLDDEGTLIISGTGKMDNYSSTKYDCIPWFNSRRNIKTIIVQDDVTSIGEYAFYYCEYVTSISIPTSVTSIGKKAFLRCYNLPGINIPSSVTSIGAGAFNECSNLLSISIPGGVTSIGEEMFDECYALSNINISSSVASIGARAFADCKGLTSINIPDSVTSIGALAFVGCENLTSISIPSSVTSIGEGAFYKCENLTSISMPDGVTNIGKGMFDECYALSNINIPSSVTSIGGGAFEGCRSLTSISIPDSVTSIGGYAFGGCRITSISIPDSVTSIGEYAFINCENLTSINIPDGVTSIEEGTFAYCENLTSISIPDGVTSIGKEAFWDCNSLTDVYYSGSEDDWKSISIDSYNDRLTKAAIHYGYEIGETVINLDSAFDGSPNKEFTISANVTSKKVAPDNSNVTWTLSPSDGQEGNITWGSMFAITTGEGQYIISKPVTVSAVGMYKLTVSFNGVSATAEVVIDSSLKAKFPILRQNELKEYYTYYNGTEMKPGFTAEMDGENVSLDRLTYHYEDNDKPGMAKLVIDTLDGNTVMCETKFLVLPGIIEEPTVKSENAGELTVNIKPIDDWEEYQIAIFDDNNLVDGYPKELVIKKTNEEGSFKKYIGMLQMEKEYIFKIRAVVDVNGEPHGGAWIASKAKTNGIVNITPESEIDTGFNNIYITLGLDNIRFTGKGGIYFCDASTNKPVISMVPNATLVSETLEFEDGKISIVQGGRIHLEINTKAKALNIDNYNVETRSGHSVLKADTEYYVQIDPGTIEYSHVDEETGLEVVHDGGFIGLTKGDASFKTIGYYAPTYKNPTGSEIALAYFSNLYGRNKASDVQKFDDSGNGWCYGFSAAFSSYYRGNPEIRSIVDQVPLFTDVDLWTCGNNNYSFEDYVKYGQAYLHSLLIAQQREKNKNKIDSLIQAVKSKQYPIIHFSSKKNGGHAVAAIEVIEELNDTTIIRVYDPSSNSQFCSHTLKIKNDGSWEYGVYSNHTHDISYSFFTEECENDITKLDYIKKNNYLFVYINNILDSKKFIGSSSCPFP